MSGIIFLGTRDLASIREFYLSEVGAELWQEQADCIILKHGNLLLGFCQREKCETGGIITFFYPTKQEVDNAYRKFRDRAGEEPKINEKYRIYHFFAHDPEGRIIEFQSFLLPVPSHLNGEDLLTTRRSVRRFLQTEVPESLLRTVFASCRFSPTSCNSESYYYIVIHDRGTIGSSAPIAQAPIAVAVCSDPGRSRRPVQDGCIAAYHFILSCWNSGLGTCWIAAMDRDDVKRTLGIPLDHYIATITPVGFPADLPDPPARRSVEGMVRILH